MLLSATCDETDRISHSFIDRNLLNRCVTRMFLSPFIVMLIFYGRFNPIGCSPIFLSNKDYYTSTRQCRGPTKFIAGVAAPPPQPELMVC